MTTIKLFLINGTVLEFNDKEMEDNHTHEVLRFREKISKKEYTIPVSSIVYSITERESR